MIIISTDSTSDLDYLFKEKLQEEFYVIYLDNKKIGTIGKLHASNTCFITTLS